MKFNFKFLIIIFSLLFLNSCSSLGNNYPSTRQTQNQEKCYRDNSQSFLAICSININDGKINFKTKSKAKVNVLNLVILLQCSDTDILNGNKVYKEFRGRVGILEAYSENTWNLEYDGYVDPNKCNKYKIKVLDFNI
tara:strand:- start:150 stop:560 length:411 start_codon:yes stop_codon:yes gene_type:complete